MTEKQT